MHNGHKRLLGWPIQLALGLISLLQEPLHASDAEAHKIRVGLVGPHLFFHLPVTVAKEKGYFKDQGIDVEWVEFTGGADAAHALLTKKGRCCINASRQSLRALDGSQRTVEGKEKDGAVC